MDKWQILNGVIILQLSDNTLYYPQFAELYEQKDNDLYVHEDISYAPLSELKLRFSKIGVSETYVKTDIDEKMSVSPIAVKRGVEYSIAFANGMYCDYIIINNVCYPIYGFIEHVNSVITKFKINPHDVTFAQYMELSRALNDVSVELRYDNILEKIDSLRKDESDKTCTAGLKANLFPYQKSGLNWLSFMMDNQCGCVLGDEMGLGKTLQVIATLGHIKEIKGTLQSLVICPVSLLENWKREIAKFYPSLSCIISHGPSRSHLYLDLLPYDIVITAYSSLQTDSAMLQMIDWDVIIIDEAQNIKNPNALRTKYLKRLSKKAAIAVSGTPFENHMTDVWSIIDFVIPSYLGPLSSFVQKYSDDIQSAQLLEKIISPIIIRRRVKDVGKSLPLRIDVPVPLVMTEHEAVFYENGRKAALDNYGLTEMSLDKIQKLRMFCTHPFVYDSSLDNSNPIAYSNKYARLCEILDEIFMCQEKVIIFSSFSRMIQLIVNDIRARFNVYTNYIDGSVNADNRQNIVDEFSAVYGSAVLVLNPNAAGTGLNITAANHVIHYNLEWNPAKEDQASARAYRTGQTKTVVVHRLYYVNTIEEIINNKIQYKRNLSENAIVGNVGSKEDQAALIEALNKSPLNTNII